MNAIRISNQSLDGFRGALAIIVCFAHSWQILINPQFGPLNWDHAILGMSARLAVVAFYVLSGWVICYSVLQNIYTNQGFNSKDWALNRILRIAPPLFLSIALVTLLWIVIRITSLDQTSSLYGLARADFSYKLRKVVHGVITLGFKGDLTGGINGPLWSLAFEIQLYFLVFLAFLLGARNCLYALVVMAWALYRTTLDPNILLAYGAFGAGFLGAWLSSKELSTPFVARLSKYVGTILCVGSVLQMMHSYHLSPTYLDHLAEIESVSIQLLFALGFTFFLFGAPLFEWNWSVQASKFSYTLYILHFPILLFFSYCIYKSKNLMSHPIMAWMIWFFAACCAIYISYLVGTRIEQSKRQKKWLLDYISTNKKIKFS